MSKGTSSRDSNDPNSTLLLQHVEDPWLHFLPTSQLSELKVKDVSLCKRAEKDESNVSTLAMIRPITAPEATNNAKDDESFKSRKRVSASMKYFSRRRAHDEQLLVLESKCLQ